MSNYMGVDIGTSGCKAAVFDKNGRQVSISYREYNIITPQPGWAELNPDEVIEKCFEVITEATSQVEPQAVLGLGISCQGEAFTVIDKDGKTLCNALVSSDIRAVEYAQNWSKEFGEEKLYKITGHTAHPMFSLFKLLWLKDNRPEIWGRAEKFLCFEDLLEFRLGLEPAMGWPLAGRTMLFDVVTHQWNSEILDAVGIKPTQLAKPLQSGSIAGNIKPDITRKLGLAKNAFVVTGGHDQPCSALGAGVTESGIAVYATGTVDCITPAFKEAVFTEHLRQNNLCTYDHVVPGMYATVAFSLTGGNILKWFRDEFGAAEVDEAKRSGRDAYELLLETAGNEPSNLLVLPYFAPSSGTPHFDTQTPGAIIGLRLTTTRGEIIRGLLEGVAMEMRLNLDILEHSGGVVDELRAIGGGAKSRSWTQLKADVMGKPIAVMDVTEAGCLGVAMLAAAKDMGRNLVELTDEWVTPLEVITPRKQQSEFYNKQFETYKKLYPAIKGIGKV